MFIGILARPEGIRLLVKAEFGFAAAFVRTVAFETTIGNDGTDVPVILQKIRRSGWKNSTDESQQHGEQDNKQN